MMMKKYWMFVPAIMGLVACNSGDADNSNAESAETTSTEVAQSEEAMPAGELMFFGDTVTFENAISTEEMMAVLNESDSAQLKVKGEISAVCTKKGCWMSMPLPEGGDMHVSYNYEFLLPTGGIEGKEVVVEGQVKKVVHSVEYLRHLAEDAGKSAEEIEAITEPKTKVSFLATGVTIKS